MHPRTADPGHDGAKERGRDGQCNLQHNLAKLATNYAAEEELIRDSTYSEPCLYLNDALAFVIAIS